MVKREAKSTKPKQVIPVHVNMDIQEGAAGGELFKGWQMPSPPSKEALLSITHIVQCWGWGVHRAL